ncbi:unnamed protein product [Dovyalis caffra]|uniref:Uncharacterized protein n=1 Tax=Dovyalis caffra TaxID=77055 RepID=A0AAV1SS21_9ROSI|nr:unnamed protein product [Dovyalis caffra]
MSDYHDLPFNDILDWNSFSIIVKEDKVPDLEKILKGIPEEKFKKLSQNVLQVHKHFKWNSPPVKYDEFHMVMYELWQHRHIEDNVPNLEKILQGIPEEKYKKMHQNLLQVREHLKWHSPPVKYDEFHMVMYELWKNRHIIRY